MRPLLVVFAVVEFSAIAVGARVMEPAEVQPAVVPHDENPPQAVRSTPRSSKKRNKFGPPPPGYIRIVGHPVPGWTPDQMFLPAARGLTWYPLGPRPITHETWSGDDNASGRCVSIAPHPTDSNIVYVASASGGVWKTTNAGGTWIPISDQLPILNHGCVALDSAHPDTVYVGTGEYTTGSAGDGLFRSPDGGATWERIAATNQVGSTCSRIIVDPTNALRIHVTGNIGYCRTTDGGATWTRPLGGACSDLAMNSLNPNIIYVARHADGIYRSTDAGQTLTKLPNGLPTTDVQRIVLAISHSSPNILYAALINGNAGLRGFYKTVDGGASWLLKPNTPNFPYPQGWYDAFVGVDPATPNTVYCGGVFPSYAPAGVIKSTNGGDSWTEISIDNFGNQLHPDQHTITWGPNGTLWIGNDGGVWKSATGGSRWINTNATLTVTQNYNIALHPTDPAQVMGGTQDNGTVGRATDVLEWPQVVGGDGGFLAYDTNDPLRKYTTYVYLTIFRIRGGDWAEITGPWEDDSRNFIAPLVMAPSDPRTLYGGTNRVWKTSNADTFAEWNAISTSQVAGGGTLNAIGLCAAAPNTIYTGSSTGAVWTTEDGGPPWFQRTAGLPSGQISDICVHPAEGSTAYVANANTSGPRVLRTENFGGNWTDMSFTLPVGVGVAALAVDWRFDPPGLLVGAGAGIYWSYDGGATWTKSGSDLPNVNIGDLQIDFVRETITAGTYGRGAWRADLPPAPQYGDTNCDGSIAFDDIDAFVLALSDPAGYEAMYPSCNVLSADCNHDGQVNFDDVNWFVALIGR